MKKLALMLPLIIGLMSCGGSSAPPPSPTSPITGQWEFTITPVNAPTFFMEIDFDSTSQPTMVTGGGLQFQTSAKAVLLSQGGGIALENPDACGDYVFNDEPLTFVVNSPAEGEFNSTYTGHANFASGGSVTVTSSVVGTFTSSTLEGSYLSTATNPPCPPPTDSGTVQGVKVQSFSGTWSGIIGQNSVQLSFQPVAGSPPLVAVVAVNGTTFSGSANNYAQTGALLTNGTSTGGTLTFLEVANTTDGYPPGQSGPAIYFDSTSNGAGVLTPAP